MDARRMSTLLSLDPEDRYWYTVDRVATTGLFWGLKNTDGWMTPRAPDGAEFLPLWPDRALAQVVGDLVWPGSTPSTLPLDLFVTQWVAYIEGLGVQVGVFPDTDVVFWQTGAQALFDVIDDAAQSLP